MWQSCEWYLFVFLHVSLTWVTVYYNELFSRCKRTSKSLRFKCAMSQATNLHLLWRHSDVLTSHLNHARVQSRVLTWERWLQASRCKWVKWHHRLLYAITWVRVHHNSVRHTLPTILVKLLTWYKSECQWYVVQYIFLIFFFEWRELCRCIMTFSLMTVFVCTLCKNHTYGVNTALVKPS